jgi:hypothetical protein
MNHRVTRYFDIQELVCPHVYDKFGLYAWQFFDPRLLDVLLAIREGIGKPIIVNNWSNGGNFSQRGLRCNCCMIVRDKTALEKLYVSAHLQGMGVDFNVQGMNTQEVHEWLKKNQILLPHPIRIEENTDGWVHIDVRSDGFRAITWFKG